MSKALKYITSKVKADSAAFEATPFYGENVNSPEKSAKFLRPFFHDVMGWKERFAVLFLNNANNAVSVSVISDGGVSGTMADEKVIFQLALLNNASAIILCHNHPSGNLTPSEQDKKLTDRMKLGGDILGVKVLDHIILTEQSYYSFADKGLI